MTRLTTYNLRLTTTIMESIFDELDKKNIASQRFWLAIIVCSLSISLSYVDLFTENYGYKAILFLSNMTLGIVILSFFKKYLQNFRSGRAGYWIKWWIVMYVVMIITSLVYGLISTAYHLSNNNPYLWSYYILLFAFNYFAIRAGIILRKIPNDFIGLLRTMGFLYIFLMPSVELISLIEYSDYVKKILGGHNPLFHLVLNTFYSAPILLLIVIFYRAIQHRKMQETILGARDAE